MKYIGQMLLLMLGMVVSIQAVPPVLNYAGQVAVDGEVFDGNGLFKFALVNADGTTTYWSNDETSKGGSEPKASVSVPVNGGLYSILLGNTALKGMGAIDPAVFVKHTDAKLRVWFSDGVNGFQQLSPDRPFASVPYAFSAGTAQNILSAFAINGTFGATITNPYGILGTPVVHTSGNYTVPSGKVLVVTGKYYELDSFGKQVSQQNSETVAIFPSETQIGAGPYGWTGMLFDPMQGIEPLVNFKQRYVVPVGSYLVVTSCYGVLTVSGEKVRYPTGSLASIFPGGTEINNLSSKGGWTGYLIDSNASEIGSPSSPIQSGGITLSMLAQDVLDKLNEINATIGMNRLSQEVVSKLEQNATITDGSVTTAKLDATILKYLKPEIILQPKVPDYIFDGQAVMLKPLVKGKYLNFQWYHNFQPIAGAKDGQFEIGNVSKTLHDGNYTVVVSNEFGSITSDPITIDVNTTSYTHTISSINLKMLFCPPGQFSMGQKDLGFSTPVHDVTLTRGFYLGRYEVTQAQYAAVMTNNTNDLNPTPSEWPNNPNRPVENVSLNDVQIFLTRLNQQEETNLPAGWKYTLPTEAQWEYACRAGSTTNFSWGNDINFSRANYNWDGNSSSGNDFKQTCDVGKYPPNQWGFYDMHGNVHEWVSDFKGDYQSVSQTNPTGPDSGKSGIFRGGAWGSSGWHLNSATRIFASFNWRSKGVGFRVSLQKSQ